MKNILVIYYSQTGQTKKMVDKFSAELGSSNIDVLEINEKPKYMFPWKVSPFFRLFPLCIMGVCPPIDVNWDLARSTQYDLIVIGYQVWFLSPSLPVQALMKDPKFLQVSKNTEVLSLISARNMWVSAVKRVNQALKSNGVGKVTNFVLCDLAPTWATFVTTPRWLLTGKREPFWIFPRAGVAENEFDLVGQISKSLTTENSLEKLVLQTSHRQKSVAYLAEKIGYQYFKLMAYFIQTVCPKESAFKDLLLLLFRIGLVLLILLSLPISALIVLIFGKKIRARINQNIDQLLKV